MKVKSDIYGRRLTLLRQWYRCTSLTVSQDKTLVECLRSPEHTAESGILECGRLL